MLAAGIIQGGMCTAISVMCLYVCDAKCSITQLQFGIQMWLTSYGFFLGVNNSGWMAEFLLMLVIPGCLAR